MRLFMDNYLQISDLVIYNPHVVSNIKITTLGDLHISEIIGSKKLNPIMKQLEKEKSDYYVFLGDLVDAPSELTKIEKQMELLKLLNTTAQIAPTMVILGSHDYVTEEKQSEYFDYKKDFFNKMKEINNLYLLNDMTYTDSKVFFMGYLQSLKYYYGKKQEHKEDLDAFYREFSQKEELYKNLPNNLPKIGLIHSPEYANDERNVELLKEYDLLIGGHDHDGLIPFGIGSWKRGIISPKKALFPNNVRGYRQLSSGTNMLISGGIVKIQNCAPKLLHPLNHLCPMQMDTIKLTNDKDSESKTKRLIYINNI